MRDARPFANDFLVDDHLGSVVFDVQFVPHVVQHIGGDRFAGFRPGVEIAFEFGEHRLTEHGGAD